MGHHLLCYLKDVVGDIDKLLKLKEKQNKDIHKQKLWLNKAK
jgi:hypothetical protein